MQGSTHLKTVADSSDDPIKTPREYTSDLVVVLDLDECLIHTDFAMSMSFYKKNVARQAEKDNKDGKQEEERKRAEVFEIRIPHDGGYTVYERPFVREFLEAISQNFETHLYTAGPRSYVTEVLKELDPDGTIFTKAWTRQFCDEGYGAFLKNLGKLKFSRGNHDPKRTVFVDNSIHSFRSNPQNGILVPDFYSDPDDGELQKVLDLIRELDQNHLDVRPVLDERFGLKAKLA